ncbi:MAG: hypothetical protein ACI8RZ_005268 [Myxococcota bacterium]|jgi:hypothetical protein
MARPPKKRKLPRKKKIKVKKEIVWVWKDRGWTARIIKREDGDGWAITMTRDGDAEPAYMAPWTMGRNKVDPKPMSSNAFNTWIKSATEFLARSQYQIRTADRNVFTIYTEENEKLSVAFDLDRGDYETEGVLTATDDFGNEIARCVTSPRFEMTIDSAQEWVDSGFEAPPPPPEPEVVLNDDDDVWDPDAEVEENIEEETFVPDEYIQEYEEPVFEYD